MKQPFSEEDEARCIYLTVNIDFVVNFINIILMALYYPIV